MHFSPGLYFFATCIILVHYDIRHTPGQEVPNSLEPADSCVTLDIRRQLIDSRENAVIKPRAMLVPLMPHPGYEYNPKVVLVSRCSGQCTGQNVPMPTIVNTTNVAVQRYPAGHPELKECGMVEVENHISCKCKPRED